MNEEKNNLENNNPENLNYSFDFSSQVEPEVQTPEAPVQPQMVDVSVPVMEETQTETVVEAPVQTPEAPVQPQMVDVSVPVMEETQTETVVEAPAQTPEAPVQPQAQPAQQQVTTETVQTETTEELKDGKSTIRFVIILGIIIVAFIIALPFVLNFLGY